MENINEGIRLAPNIMIEGGIPPYTYRWSAITKPYENWDALFYASSYLNDTTLLNPVFKSGLNNDKWERFYLEIKDSQGNIVEDSINVRFSRFVYSTGYSGIEINYGDSVLLKEITIGNGIEPYIAYEWDPKEGLQTPYEKETWSKPEKSTLYVVRLTDSAGCISSYNESFHVIVNNTSIEQNELSDFYIYQSGEMVFFENPEASEIVLSFYDLSGKLVHKKQTTRNSYRPDLSLPSGIYVCKVKYGNVEKSLKYIVKEYNR